MRVKPRPLLRGRGLKRGREENREGDEGGRVTAERGRAASFMCVATKSDMDTTLRRRPAVRQNGVEPKWRSAESRVHVLRLGVVLPQVPLTRILAIFWVDECILQRNECRDLLCCGAFDARRPRAELLCVLRSVSEPSIGHPEEGCRWCSEVSRDTSAPLFSA